MKTVVIAGASGFIGRALVKALRGSGYRVLALKRTTGEISEGAALDGGALDGGAGITGADGASRGQPAWDPAAGKLDPGVLAGAHAVVCLSGYSIGAKRWNPRVKETLYQSRLQPLQTLGNAIEKLEPAKRPRMLLAASAVGYYGQTPDAGVDETGPHGHDFLAGLCRAVEAQAAKIPVETVTYLRTGLVIGDGGMMAKLGSLYKLGLGGPLGSGKHWMPTISLRDHVRATQHLLENPLPGPVNLTGPNPVTNTVFTRALAAHYRRPALLPVPPIALRLAVGEFGRTLTCSQRVYPAALQRAGFEFLDPDVASQLAAPG